MSGNRIPKSQAVLFAALTMAVAYLFWWTLPVALYDRNYRKSWGEMWTLLLACWDCIIGNGDEKLFAWHELRKMERKL